MTASSVTGLSGPGESHGLYKPELHCGGCACACQGDDCDKTVTTVSVGCYITTRSGGTTAIQSGGYSTVKGC